MKAKNYQHNRGTSYGNLLSSFTPFLTLSLSHTTSMTDLLVRVYAYFIHQYTYV